MKTILGLILLIPLISFSQWKGMSRYNDVGGTNFQLHVNNVDAAFRLISETLEKNNFCSEKDILFKSGSNMPLYSYKVDPLNNEFVYVVMCLRDPTGWIISYQYLENRYRYFFDIMDDNNRVHVIYDPALAELK